MGIITLNIISMPIRNKLSDSYLKEICIICAKNHIYIYIFKLENLFLATIQT